MSHFGTEKDWKGLLEFYTASLDYVPTLKRITLAQWILESRADGDSQPGTSELSKNAVNFCGLMYNSRMATFGAGKYSYKGNDFCRFDNVEHFVDGYFYFIASGNYNKWHLLAHRPLDFISHLQENGFAGKDDTYTRKVEAIYKDLSKRFKINLPESDAVQHTVSHGEYTYKIAESYKVEASKLFKLERNGAIHYGSEIGIIYTGDVLYVLTEEKLPETAGDPLANLNTCTRPKGDCAGRTHFVIHQTVAGNLTKSKIMERYAGKRGKAHAYILKSGEVCFLWAFTEKNVYATKAEIPSRYKPSNGSFPDFPLLGKLIHIEIDYEENGKPNEAQYKSLAQLYIEACKVVGRILTIVPHIEVDRGIRNGHNDPQNFDYNSFYKTIKVLGVDTKRIPKFAHDRYWGKDNYKIPFDEDTFHFPPLLEGNPHAKT